MFCAECVRIFVFVFFREILTKNIYEGTIKTLIRCWFDRQSLLNKSIKTLPDSMVSIYDLFIQISMVLAYMHSRDFLFTCVSLSIQPLSLCVNYPVEGPTLDI